MPNYYSGTEAEIKKLMREIGVGDSLTDTMDSADVEFYQAQVDGIIDAKLSAVYETPLRQITRGSNEAAYPNSIKYLAARWVSAEIVLNEMTEIEPNVSRKAEKQKKEAQDEFFELVKGALVGSSHLDGQIKRTRNRFVPPGIAPMAEVEKPT